MKKRDFAVKKHTNKKLVEGKLAICMTSLKAGKVGHMQEALEVISEAQACRDLLHRALNSPSFSSQPPSEEKINGILLGYRIRYRELLYDRLRSYSVHTISSVSTWAELTGEGHILVFSQHSLFLTVTYCSILI